MADPVVGIADAVVAEALSWAGTPYRHQGSRKAVGCDCLGLVRGVWRTVYGSEMEQPVPYTSDWADVAVGEALLAGARRHLCEKSVEHRKPGDVLLFRWRSHLPAGHAGILIAEASFVHAYEGAGAVTKSVLVPQWQRRIAAVFSFPDPLKS